MGGEKTDDRLKGLRDLGSPPRGRGKVLPPLIAAVQLRITPAWAGKSLWFASFQASAKDHPRVGGEKNAIS